MQSGRTFKKRIDELVASSFIEQFTPFGKAKKDTHLKVIDEYTLFYLHWIERARRGRSTLANRNYWSSASQGPGYRAWSGYALEAVCFKHIDRILHALELEGLALEIGSWYQAGHQTQGKQQAGKPVVSSNEQVRSRAAGAQIDLLFDRSDNAIMICEIKHSADRFVVDKRYAEDLVNKMRIFEQSTRIRKTLYLALISANGLKRNVWSEDLVNAVVTLDDLFQAGSCSMNARRPGGNRSHSACDNLVGQTPNQHGEGSNGNSEARKAGADMCAGGDHRVQRRRGAPRGRGRGRSRHTGRRLHHGGRWRGWWHVHLLRGQGHPGGARRGPEQGHHHPGPGPCELSPGQPAGAWHCLRLATRRHHVQQGGEAEHHLRSGQRALGGG